MNGKNNVVIFQQIDSDDEPPALIDLSKGQNQNSRQTLLEQPQENQKIHTLVSNSSNIYPSLGSIQEVPEETKREIQMAQTIENPKPFDSILGKTIVLNRTDGPYIEQKIDQITEELIENLKERLIREDDELSEEQFNEIILQQKLNKAEQIQTSSKKPTKKDPKNLSDSIFLIKIIQKLLIERNSQRKNTEYLMQTIENLYHQFLKIEISTSSINNIIKDQNVELMLNTNDKEKFLKMQIQSLNLQIIEKQKENENSLQQYQNSYEEMEQIMDQLKQTITEQLKEIRHWKQSEQILNIQSIIKQQKQINLLQKNDLAETKETNINSDRNQNNLENENQENSNQKGRNQSSNSKGNQVKLLSADFFKKFGKKQ